MIPSTQKPTGQGDLLVGRPATGKTPLQHLRVPQEDWDDLRALAGRKAHAVIRDFIRWYLRRPGAKAPERPSAERMAEIVTARLAAQPDAADEP